jgi:gluconate kinase
MPFSRFTVILSELRKRSKNKVAGVIVCSGVMPSYENDIRKQKDIKVLIYGWKLRSQSW